MMTRKELAQIRRRFTPEKNDNMRFNMVVPPSVFRRFLESWKSV